jgi:hypothetical protein
MRPEQITAVEKQALENLLRHARVRAWRPELIEQKEY